MQTLTLSMAHHFAKTARRATGAAVIAAPAAAEGGAERAPRGATRQSKRGSWGRRDRYKPPLRACPSAPRWGQSFL